MSNKKTLEVLFSPTTRCNLRCRYCYVNQTQPKSVSDMSIEDINTIYKWLSKFATIIKADKIRFTWFGGEPLLPGTEFLKEALAAQKSDLGTMIEVVNSMQSNLTLVTDELIPLLKEYFHSSISGSVDYQNRWRKFPNGDDSHAIVEKNIKKLLDSGINVGAVCTLTRQNIHQANEIYSYFKRLGTAFRVNRAAGTRSRMSNEFLTVSEYNAFVKEIFDLYLSDPNPTVEFFNFTMMAKLFLSGQPAVCVDTLEPFFYLGFEAHGRITSRCRFVGQAGNYETDTPESFYQKLKASVRPHPSPQRCQGCEFFNKVCLGGCFGEMDVDCFSSNCGYRTETTYDLWCYVRDFLNSHGHKYAEARRN